MLGVVIQGYPESWPVPQSRFWFREGWQRVSVCVTEKSHEQGDTELTYLESSSENFSKTDLKFAVNEFSSD